eukprot:5686522-Prymnesium_polylepis.1
MTTEISCERGPRTAWLGSRRVGSRCGLAMWARGLLACASTMSAPMSMHCPQIVPSVVASRTFW